MRLFTVSASDTCWECKGTGVKGERTPLDGGGINLKLIICRCVQQRVIKPKRFAEEVAEHLEKSK